MNLQKKTKIAHIEALSLSIPRETPYLTVETHLVNVSIDNQVATTRVDQIFRNDSQWSLRDVYLPVA